MFKMETITIPKSSFGKILNDVEVLIEDIEKISQAENEVIKGRIQDINTNPAIGKTEEELDEYLLKRGLKLDRLDD